jgi:hypothetical protein
MDGLKKRVVSAGFTSVSLHPVQQRLPRQWQQACVVQRGESSASIVGLIWHVNTRMNAPKPMHGLRLFGFIPPHMGCFERVWRWKV